MQIGSALVLFAVVWFMVFFVILPIGLTTQGDAGVREKGTPASAPARLNLRRKVRLTTAFAVVIWLIAVWVISSGFLSVETLDFYKGTAPANNS